MICLAMRLYCWWSGHSFLIVYQTVYEPASGRIMATQAFNLCRWCGCRVYKKEQVYS